MTRLPSVNACVAEAPLPAVTRAAPPEAVARPLKAPVAERPALEPRERILPRPRAPRVVLHRRRARRHVTARPELVRGLERGVIGAGAVPAGQGVMTEAEPVVAATAGAVAEEAEGKGPALGARGAGVVDVVLDVGAEAAGAGNRGLGEEKRRWGWRWGRRWGRLVAWAWEGALGWGRGEGEVGGAVGALSEVRA